MAKTKGKAGKKGDLPRTGRRDDKAITGGGAGGGAADATPGALTASELTKEMREIEDSGLQDKLDRLQSKTDDLVQENEKLRLLLGKQKEDQADIYEFLKQKLMQKDEEINQLEDKVIKLEENKERVELELESKLETEKGIASEIQVKLNEEINQLKDELAELAEFKTHKADLESELEETKAALANERKDHANVVAELERKVVQEKDRLKKEMLQKIKEAKANLLKMTDSQLATTTKRTIMENEQMSSELNYQSKRTVELIHKNEKLLFDNQTIKRRLDLLLQEQEEMAKRNNSSQKVIKMLLNKLNALEENKREERMIVESRKDQEISSLIDELTYRDERLGEIMREMTELKRQNGELLAEKERSETEHQRMLATLNDAAQFLLTTLENTRYRLTGKGDHGMEGGFNPEDLAPDEEMDNAMQMQPFQGPSVLEELNMAERERMLRFMLARINSIQKGGGGMDGRLLTAPDQHQQQQQSLELTNESAGRPTTSSSLPPIGQPPKTSESSRRPPSTPALYSFGSPLHDRNISTAAAAMMGEATVSTAVQTESQQKFFFGADMSSSREEAQKALLGPVRDWGKRADDLPLTRHSPANYLRKGAKKGGAIGTTSLPMTSAR